MLVNLFTSISFSLVVINFAELEVISAIDVSYIFAALPVMIHSVDYSLMPAAQEVIPHILII